MEVYQWLFHQNGFRVAKTGYFVYCNGKKSNDSFDGKLEFDIKLIPYIGNDSWVEPTVFEIKTCLDSGQIPEQTVDCEYCQYSNSLTKIALANLAQTNVGE